MDTRYLTYILTIARKKNMTKAAEELFVSQSSLSQYLTKLEQEIGTPLFFRARGELVLTPAGQLYTEAACRVLRIKEQLYKDIASLDNKGHITIGCTSQFALLALTEIVPRFKSYYPDYRVEITEQSLPALTKMLLEENIDLGLMAANTVKPFDAELADVLRQEEVLFALPTDHPYTRENPNGPIPQAEFVKRFRDENFLLSRKGSTLRVLADQLFEKYQFEPSAMCETNSIVATQIMVSNGTGVTFLGETCTEEGGPVACYSLEPKLYRLNLLVRRKHWILNEAEQLFCRLTREWFQPERE